MRVHVVLQACVLMVGLLAQAAEASAPAAPAGTTPAQAPSWGDLPGDPLDEKPPKPPPLEEPEEEPADPAVVEDANLVARDAFLGGFGIFGPLLLLPVYPCNYLMWGSGPLLGGLAAAWAQERAGSTVAGQWIRGTLAAYAAALARLVLTYLGYGLILPLYLLTLVPYFTGVTITAVAVLWLISRGQPAQNWGAVYMGGIGASIMLTAFAGFLYSLIYLMPYALADRVGVAAGDVIWKNLLTKQTNQPPSRFPNPAQVRMRGEPPLPLPLASALMASAARGAWERSAHLELLPVVGPFIAAAAARKKVATRVEQAARVAGLTGVQGVQRETDVVLFTKAFLFGCTSVGWPLAALGLMATGAMTIATGVVWYFSLYGGVAMVPAMFLTFLVTAMIGWVAFTAPALLVVVDSVVPWVLTGAVLANRSSVEPEPPPAPEPENLPSPVEALEDPDVTE